jgi:uncharacterized protein (TIGR02271 family)
VEHRSDKDLRHLRPMRDTELTVADGEPDVRGWTVVDTGGRPLGRVDELIVDTDSMKVRYFELEPDQGRQRAFVPAEAADLDTGRRIVVLPSSDALRRDMTIASASAEQPDVTGSSERDGRPSERDTQRLTRAEEEVRIGTRARQTGEVRVSKHVETAPQREDVPVMHERVNVERRPVSESRPADEIRGSAEEIRVPVIEEEVIVEKRPVVKEELIISKDRVEETRPVDVEVKREEFDIEPGSADVRGSEATRIRDTSKQRGGR